MTSSIWRPRIERLTYLTDIDVLLVRRAGDHSTQALRQDGEGGDRPAGGDTSGGAVAGGAGFWRACSDDAAGPFSSNAGRWY